MKTSVRFLLFCLAVFVAGAVRAADPLAYADVLRLADERNPRLVQARADVAAAEGRLAEARLYPNPFVEGESEEFDEDDGHRSTVAIGQPIVVGKRRSAEIRMRQADAEARRLELEQARREVHREAAEQYVGLLYHRDNLALAWAIYDDAEKVKAAALALRAQGSAPSSDADRATAAAEESYLDVTRHIAETTFAAQRLEILLGGYPIHIDDLRGRLLDGMVSAEVRMARDGVAADHPEFRAAEARTEIERRDARLARADVVPDLTLRAGIGYAEATDETFGMAGFSIPIPLWDRNQGRIREAEARTVRAEAERDDAERRLGIGVLELSQRINELDTFVQGYAEAILPPRQAAYAATTKAYADGQTTIHDILSAQSEYFAARRQLLENRWMLAEAHVRLRYYLDGEGLPDIFAAPE